ncbi:MAG: hypothetical protein ACRD9R_03285 [Pyrinomonadaceae bacterium]
MSRTLNMLVAGVSMTGLLCAGLTFDGSPGGATVSAASVVEPLVEPQRGEGVVVPIDREGFEVEILVNGVAQEKYPARGRLYVEALKGAEYALRIRNPLPVRVAVALSVDGLNTIDARRTTAREASKWVVPPYSSITVGGWQMSGSRARRFYFTTEPGSYAAKLGRPADVGVISAVFFREQPSSTQIVPSPRQDPAGRAESRARDGVAPAESAGAANKSAAESSRRERAVVPEDDYAATGIGRSVHNDVYRVSMNLAPSPVVAFNIRYEYRPELVRLGILPRPHSEPDRLRRRERARGFEDRDFCPEP